MQIFLHLSFIFFIFALKSCKIEFIAIQTGEYTFKIDEDYFGNDPKRLWSGITICVEADGNDEYKGAVQEA